MFKVIVTSCRVWSYEIAMYISRNLNFNVSQPYILLMYIDYVFTTGCFAWAAGISNTILPKF